MNASQTKNAPEKTPRRPTVWQWLVLSLGLVGAMAFLAAHAPPSWQRPGPTALLFAVAVGIVMGGIAVVNGIENRRLVFLAALGIISLAIAGMTGERYRLYVKSLENLYLGPVQSRSIHDSVVQEMLLPARREKFESERPFPVYLEFRVRALGISMAPWPLVYWMGEIVLGGILGAVLAVRWQTWQMQAKSASPDSAE